MRGELALRLLERDVRRRQRQIGAAQVRILKQGALTGRHTVKGPAPDRLFAISTAYVTLESAHQIDPTGTAAIVFQALATSEFEATLRDMEEVVTATGGDSGTRVATQDDSFGYRWMVLRNPDGAPSVEDLAVGINAVSGSIETANRMSRRSYYVDSGRGSDVIAGAVDINARRDTVLAGCLVTMG